MVRIKLRVNAKTDAPVDPYAPAQQQQQQQQQQQPKDVPLSEKMPLYPHLEQLLEQMERKDVYALFVPKVDTSLVTDYLTVIKRPMSFDQMRQLIKDKQYATVDEFRADVDLLCDNAMLYNKPDTIYYKQAKKLKQAADGVFKRVLGKSVLMTLQEQQQFEIQQQQATRSRKRSLAIAQSEDQTPGILQQQQEVGMRTSVGIRQASVAAGERIVKYRQSSSLLKAATHLDDGSAIMSDRQYFRMALCPTPQEQPTPLWQNYGVDSTLQLDLPSVPSRLQSPQFQSLCILLYGDMVSREYLQSLETYAGEEVASRVEQQYTRGYSRFLHHVESQFQDEVDGSDAQLLLKDFMAADNLQGITARQQRHCVIQRFLHQLRKLDTQVLKQFGDISNQVLEQPVIEGATGDDTISQEDSVAVLLDKSHALMAEFNELLGGETEEKVDKSMLEKLRAHLRHLAKMQQAFQQQQQQRQQYAMQPQQYQHMQQQ